MTNYDGAVGHLIRAWRTTRGKSQLALATQASISSRHLSFVETGRAKPSREMILTLAEHLDVPLRERNALLAAAGFAAAFRETPLDAAAMSEVRDALTAILRAHEPNPTLVVNRRYDVLMANDGAVNLLSFFAPSWRGKNNIARLLFSADGLRPAVMNWNEVAGHVARRLRAELPVGSSEPLDREVLALADKVQTEVSEMPASISAAATVLIPVSLRRGACAVNLFTTIATVGTPIDITLHELRIETFFAADAASKHALESIVRSRSD
jgi:transcriptional regulator with XRE-family HTH domain